MGDLHGNNWFVIWNLVTETLSSKINILGHAQFPNSQHHSVQVRSSSTNFIVHIELFTSLLLFYVRGVSKKMEMAMEGKVPLLEKRHHQQQIFDSSFIFPYQCVLSIQMNPHSLPINLIFAHLCYDLETYWINIPLIHTHDWTVVLISTAWLRQAQHSLTMSHSKPFVILFKIGMQVMNKRSSDSHSELWTTVNNCKLKMYLERVIY